MKVGIPGRAVKMPENLGGSRGHVTLGPLARSAKIPYNKIEIKPAIDYLTLGCHDEPKKAPGKAYKKELKSKGNIRPSTAVRRHVKKISEEFTMMHNKYENSSTKGQDPKDKTSPKSAPPGSSAALGKMPPSRFPRAVLSKISCSKCESLKGTGKGGVKGAPGQPCKHHRTAMSPKRSGSPQKKSCLAPSNALNSGCSPRSRSKYGSGRGCGGLEFGLAPSGHCAPRSPGRKKDTSPRPQPSTEQIKKAKIFTEKAIMEGRVFSIFGYFPAIKEALKMRGWVEKVQHSVPYVHPHPNNCVCPHVGYTSVYMSPPPLIASTSTTSTTTTTTTTATNTTSATTCTTSSSSAASTSSDSGISSGVSLDHTDSASAVGSTSGAEDAADEATPEEGPDESTSPDPSTSLPSAPPSSITSSSSSTSRSSPSPPAGQDLGQPDNIANTTSSSIVDDKTSDAVPESLSSSSSQRSDESSSSTEESSKPLELFRDHEINTAILGPSEIRKGLSNCITEKNSALFKYSTTNILKKIRSKIDQRNAKLLSEEEEEENEDENTIEEEIEEEEEGEEKQLDEEGEGEEVPEPDPVPEPYNPYVEYKLKTTDMPLVARLLRNVEPNLLWTWTRDSLSFKHLHREQLVNRFPSTPFTTKYGLCGTLQQLHWFSEAASVDTFVPRGFCIGHEDERTAFIHDYRTTACLNMLKWVTERNDTLGPHMVADQHGEVNSKRVRQALSHVEQYIQSCCHDDLDSPPPQALRDHEWGALLAAHYRMVHMDKKIKVATQDRLQNLITDCESSLRRVEPFWPQLAMDGLRNLWIVKPGAQSRGRGIFMMNHLEEILSLVQSPLIYETKYVVQKYIERPLLIHNTKFDIRQWFMVTDWNPLHVWVYKDSYLRFCSQQYDLTNNNEAIHLSNNAIQCKYDNGERSVELPEENMWDCHQFKDYLRGLKKEAEWDDVIYPGMRDSLVAAMLAAQVEMDTFKHGFELFGADFMLTEDLRPWLIEINSSPCMASTTSVTKRMCGQCLSDVIKVVVDYKQHKNADTGLFELAYRDSEKSIPNPPYLGVNLQVVGRQIKRGPVKPERRKLKRPKPIARLVKPLPMITLSLEEAAHHHGSRDHYHPHPHPNPKEGGGFAKRGCSILDCRRYGVAGNAGGSGGPLPFTSGVSTPVPPITPGDKAISEASSSIIVNCSSPPLKPSNEDKTKPSEGTKGKKEEAIEENEEEEDSTTEDTSEDSSSWSSISRSESDTSTSRPGSGDT